MYGVGLGGLDGAAWPSKTVGPDGRRTWFHWPGFGQQRARRRSHTSPRWRCLRPVTTGSRSLRQPLHSVTSPATLRSEEHTSELQSLMRISYDVLCLNKKKNNTNNQRTYSIKDYRPTSIFTS